MKICKFFLFIIIIVSCTKAKNRKIDSNNENKNQLINDQNKKNKTIYVLNKGNNVKPLIVAKK